MLVRNNTTCTSCGNCSTYDLMKGVGVFKDSGEEKVHMALLCRACSSLIQIHFDIDAFLEFVLRVRESIPSSSSWCHYVRTDANGRIDLSDSERCSVVTWAASSGFCRDLTDPALRDNPLLKALIGYVIEADSNHEYPHMPVVVTMFVGLPDGQPLAS
uniref:Uncharacterized protein n=1 Tax=Leviviridae sp. TaxID=2027243 RepID=A0A514D377_9VIRU|nr:MAG: hypothetical protein H1Rhizo27845e1082_000003 [Leviviridae sp.]